MKKLLLMFTLCFVVNANGQYLIDSLYTNKEELLINQRVLMIDSISREELINRIKNWGGVAFVNLKEVLVSETQDQLVFNYITSGFYAKSLGIQTNMDWYVRMVIQVKDGKVRIQQYDDGNGYRSGSYSGGVSIPATQARLYHLNDYFANGVSRKMYNDGFLKFKNATKSTLNSLENALKKTDSEKIDDGWR
jgi:hypothetical protein